jgi:hypothetical protein
MLSDLVEGANNPASWRPQQNLVQNLFPFRGRAAFRDLSNRLVLSQDARRSSCSEHIVSSSEF